MKTVHDFLGDTFQARTVPTLVERVAENQAAMVETFVGYLLPAETYQHTIQYFRHTTTAVRLAEYSFITKHTFISESEIPTDQLKKPLAYLLDRYGKRGYAENVQHVKTENRHTYHLTWCLRLDSALMELFEAQELPTFADTQFGGLIQCTFFLAEPIYPYDFQLLCARVEACSAALSIETIQKEHASGVTATLPATSPYPNVLEPVREQYEYVRDQLFAWQVVAEEQTPVSVTDARLAKLIERMQPVQPKAVDLPKIEPADSMFVAYKISAAVRSNVLHATPGMSREACEMYLGKPTGSIQFDSGISGWTYALKIGEALAVIEGVEDQATNVLLVSNTKPPIMEFEKLLSLLR